MSSLTRAAPRPRASIRIPSYPALILASAAAISGCASVAAPAAAPPSPAAEVPVAAVSPVAVPPPEPAPTADNPPAPPGDPPWRLNPGRYPDDNAQVAIGCGGGCPPAWQLEADYRDRRQVAARVQHCYQLMGDRKKGRVQVSVEIDAQGRARSVKAKHTGDIPALVDQCSEDLLAQVQYHATNNYARTHGFDEEFPKAVTVTLPKRGQ